MHFDRRYRGFMARRGEDHEDDPVRKAAQYRVDREAAREAAEVATEPEPAGTGRGVGDAAGGPDARDTRDGGDAGDEAGATEGVPGGPRRIRMDERSRYVDTVIDQAIRRGEFDNLPLQGKPIPSLKSGAHDPDWWLKNLVEREQITGVLPSAQLRKDDAELDEALDREVQEERVREIVEEFNARVIDARRQLLGGPPVVTPTRDVDHEVARWRQRRAARAATRSRPESAASDRTTGEKKPWWRPW